MRPATSRAMGPTVVQARREAAHTPVSGTRPHVVFSPAIPAARGGGSGSTLRCPTRMPRRPRRCPTATAEPLDDPPGNARRIEGIGPGVPKALLIPLMPKASSCRLVLPARCASPRGGSGAQPGQARGIGRRGTGAVGDGEAPRRRGAGQPTSMMSLTATRRPAPGRGLPDDPRGHGRQVSQGRTAGSARSRGRFPGSRSAPTPRHLGPFVLLGRAITAFQDPFKPDELSGSARHRGPVLVAPRAIRRGIPLRTLTGDAGGHDWAGSLVGREAETWCCRWGRATLFQLALVIVASDPGL